MPHRAGGSGSGSSNGPASASTPGKLALIAGTRCSRTKGWLRRASSTTRFVERGRVVGAQQPEGGIGERDVQQRLVTLALRQLRGASAGPDRLADRRAPADRPERGRRESACHAGMIRAGFTPTSIHVREHDTCRRRVRSSRPQRVDLLRAQHHQDRLVGGNRLADEPERSVHELVAVRVEEGLVAITRRVRPRHGTCCRSHPAWPGRSSPAHEVDDQHDEEDNDKGA